MEPLTYHLGILLWNDRERLKQTSGHFSQKRDNNDYLDDLISHSVTQIEFVLMRDGGAVLLQKYLDVLAKGRSTEFVY